MLINFSELEKGDIKKPTYKKKKSAKKKEKKWVSRYSTNTSHKKESTKTKDDDSGDFIKSAAIGYITDNPLIGGAVGGSMSGGILGSSLDGDLFN